MPITSDIRSYADTALSQGKHVLDARLAGAQAQFNDVSAKANDTVNDLRAQAEKAVNLDAIKAAVEPYLTQAKGYSHTVTDRAEALLGTVLADKRVARLVNTAESMTGVVVATVQERVVKPVQSMTGLGGGVATTPAPKPTPVKAAGKPAAPRTGAGKAPARKAPARKASARKAAPKADQA
ncbi:MAG: hypothetical protein ACRDWT_04510 [Jatrophihabitantaceae bacterium]